MFVTKMKTAAWVVLAVTLLCSGGVLSYRGVVGAAQRDAGAGPLEKQIKAEPWGKDVDGVQCRIVRDKAKWHEGEVPSFQAEVRNKGKRDLVVWQTQELCEIVLDGRTLRWSGHIEAKSSAFGPGRHYKGIAIALAEQWHDENGIPPSLTPGKHKVRVVFRPIDSNKHEPPVESLRVESNEVEIEIAVRQSQPVK